MKLVPLLGRVQAGALVTAVEELEGWIPVQASVARGNSETRDVWMTLLRDACGLTNREIGRRLGHGDGATVGKRFRELASAKPRDACS